jgi:hypothetical protein
MTKSAYGLMPLFPCHGGVGKIGVCGEANGTYRKNGLSARAPSAQRSMNSHDLRVSAASTSAASKSGAVGPFRVLPPCSRPCIIRKSRSSVGSEVTRSFSINVYGTMSSDALMPKK